MLPEHLMRAFTLSAICFSDYDFIHHRVEQAAEGKFKLGAKKKVHIYHISITKLSQIQATFLKNLYHILIT